MMEIRWDEWSIDLTEEEEKELNEYIKELIENDWLGYLGECLNPCDCGTNDFKHHRFYFKKENMIDVYQCSNCEEITGLASF